MGSDRVILGGAGRPVGFLNGGRLAADLFQKSPAL